jgi:hypothetical protein
MKKMLNVGNQIHNFISSSGSGTAINYGSGSAFITGYGSGSASQKVKVPTVPVSQHCLIQYIKNLMARRGVPHCPRRRRGRGGRRC